MSLRNAIDAINRNESFAEAEKKTLRTCFRLFASSLAADLSEVVDVNVTFSDTEVEAEHNATNAKVNALITALTQE